MYYFLSGKALSNYRTEGMLKPRESCFSFAIIMIIYYESTYCAPVYIFSKLIDNFEPSSIFHNNNALTFQALVIHPTKLVRNQEPLLLDSGYSNT